MPWKGNGFYPAEKEEKEGASGPPVVEKTSASPERSQREAKGWGNGNGQGGLKDVANILGGRADNIKAFIPRTRYKKRNLTNQGRSVAGGKKINCSGQTRSQCRFIQNRR